MADLTGQSIGRYHILEQLGEGGMATVYKAYDTRLERDVAIKIIRIDLFGAAVLECMLIRFDREAKALAHLTHPNIVSVIDYGEYEGSPYLVMIYLPGGTLKQRLGRPMPWQEAVRILLPVAQALEYAHEHNIVHRDIKPSNILLTEKGQPMLSDFGIAKILENEDAQTLTTTGTGVGTPGYMAPEQWTGQAGSQSDIYSLGVVLYELVTGRKPYIAETPAAILLKQVNDPLPRPRQFAPDLPDGVEKIIIKALAKKPEDRYSTMGEFVSSLEAIPSDQVKTKQSTIVWRKRKAEKTAEPEHVAPQVRKQVEDQSTLDARLPAEVKPIEPVAQAIGSDKTKIASPATSRPLLEEPAEKKNTVQPVTQMSKRNKFRPAWIIASLGLVAVIAFAVWGMPSLKAGISPTNTPTVTATLTLTSTPTLTLTSTPTLTLTSIPTFTPIPTLGIGTTWTRPADGMVMVYVPEGNFIMGSPSGTGNADEHPQHAVYLDAFWIDKTDVTNAMYEKCVSTGSCQAPSSSTSYTRSSYYGDLQYADYPVIFVSWNDAQAYCKWAGVRLPSEAEWEKAARGTDERTYPWGNDNPTCSLVNYLSKNGTCVGDTSQVGSYTAGASPYGALDMAGNVWEWVSDWYDPNYYANPPASNPQGPSSGTYRVLRGGSWYSYVSGLRSALRHWYNPDYADGFLGFRCSRSQ